jgi:predicted AAA+ superfamily ATPase
VHPRCPLALQGNLGIQSCKIPGIRIDPSACATGCLPHDAESFKSHSACVTVGGRPTIRCYLTLIERLFLVEFLPLWFSNRIKRLIKTPKLHFGDTGLACNLLRCSAAELDGRRKLLGQLLETFVFGEIEEQASAHPERIALHHLRDKDGYEVDIVVQRGTHHAGIEVKATSAVGEGDF